MAADVSTGSEFEIRDGQVGEFTDTQTGLDRQDQQHVISPADPRCPVRCGEQRVHLGDLEVVQLPLVVALGGDRQHALNRLGVFGVAVGGVTE